MFMGLFKRKPPEWKDYLVVSVDQPVGPGGLWFYQISGKGPDGNIYKELSGKGYEHIAAARVAGDIRAGRVYRDAIKRGIIR